ncbi:unnamed protein product [Rhizophagus irregularis]|nr:unnamed protein product [Rhizophagus irregularis]
MIRIGKYVALYGARAFGKSTWVQQFRKTLYNAVIIAFINVSFEHVEIHACIRRDARVHIDFKSSSFFESSNDLKINYSEDFLEIFDQNKWKNNIVPFVDEFDNCMKQAKMNAGPVCLCGLKKIIDDKFSFSSWFLGVFDFVPIYDDKEAKIAQFLVAEGVLIRDEMTKDAYKMSSALVDMLIRRQVIPEVYKSSPGNAVPKKCDFSLDILNILQMAVQFFDKDIISSAFDRSYKITDELYVNGIKNNQVPRESVDIVITADHQRIVLELLATATKNDLDEHFERVLKYAELLSADDIWIVHFTCEDDSAGTIEYIVDQVVPLQS